MVPTIILTAAFVFGVLVTFGKAAAKAPENRGRQIEQEHKRQYYIDLYNQERQKRR